MNFTKLMVFFCILQVTSLAFALSIIDERGQVEVDLPKSWRYEQNILGLPHVFLSPEGPHRASISLTLTGIKDVKLPVADLAKNQKQYQDGRKKWAQKRDLNILNFHPYVVKETKDKFKIHQIGFEYKNNNNVIQIEDSFYIECPKTLVHMKTLVPKNSNALKESENIVNSLQCQK